MKVGKKKGGGPNQLKNNKTKTVFLCVIQIIVLFSILLLRILSYNITLIVVEERLELFAAANILFQRIRLTVAQRAAFIKQINISSY